MLPPEPTGSPIGEGPVGGAPDVEANFKEAFSKETFPIEIHLK